MPMVTVVDEEVVRLLAAQPEDEALWVGARDLAAAGWEQKPAGLCRGPICIPLPADGRFHRGDGAVDLAALARHRGQSVVHDEEGLVWLFGMPGETLARTRESLDAPDFTLPDLDGQLHSLSQHRGKKVVLASWASW